MCRKLMSVVCLVVVLGLVGSVSAQSNWTNADPANDLWTNPGNWSPAGLPVDLALINSPPEQGPVINADVTVGEIGGLRLNSDVDQVMEISSGNVQIGWWWGLAEGGNGTATLNMVGDADIKVGGIEGGYSGATVINIGGNTKISESYEWRLCNEDGATVELNIGDDADIHMGPEKNAWRFADKGTMVTNISGNANIYVDGKWRTGDETGHAEINMSGGTLYVGRYLSCYDDGSAKITFSGGTADVDGLSFAGRAGRDYELNVTGTADVTARTEIRLRYSAGAGSPGGTATVNVSGGVLTSQGRIFMEGAHGSMNVNLTGGVVYCASFDPNGPYNMDICGGTLIITGDATADIQADIDAGYITACGGAGIVVYDYDIRNFGKTTVTAALTRGIDIKPCACPNPFNPKSKGVLPVAILGAADFDVTEIDPASIRLAGVPALRSGFEDVAGPADGDTCECGELGPDGFVDMTVKFKTQEIVLAIPDEITKGAQLVLTLDATLNSGVPITGQDCVVVVGKVPEVIDVMRADTSKDGKVSGADFFLLKNNWYKSVADYDY
jgi:hypothetical protein